MALIDREVTVNIHPGGIKPIVNVSQYDNDTGALVVSIIQKSQVWNIPEGADCVLVGTKPDGYGFSYNYTAPSGGFDGTTNRVRFSVTRQMTAVEGPVECEVIISLNSRIVGTGNFILMVERAALSDTTVISDSEIPAIENAQAYAQQASSYAQQAASSASQFYGIGTKLRSGDDLSSTNPFFSPGCYYIEPATARDKLVADYPSKSGGVVFIYSTWSTARPVQVVFTMGSEIYVRAYNGSYWSPWATLKTLGGLSSITANTDLNTVTDKGEYYFSSNTAPYLGNCPITNGGRLTVEESIGSGSSQYIRQILCQYNNPANIYIRSATFNTQQNPNAWSWTHWFKLSTTDYGS